MQQNMISEKGGREGWPFSDFSYKRGREVGQFLVLVDKGGEGRGGSADPSFG